MRWDKDTNSNRGEQSARTPVNEVRMPTIRRDVSRNDDDFGTTVKVRSLVSDIRTLLRKR